MRNPHPHSALSFFMFNVLLRVLFFAQNSFSSRYYTTNTFGDLSCFPNLPVEQALECCITPQPHCWNEVATVTRCCKDHVDLSHSDHFDPARMMPLGSPRYQQPPSKSSPVVFLHLPKTAGSTLSSWLLHSAWELGKLTVTHISQFGWPIIRSTPMLGRSYDRERLESLEILSGMFELSYPFKNINHHTLETFRF